MEATSQSTENLLMNESKVFDRGKDASLFQGDSELHEATSDTPHVVWDINPLSYWGAILSQQRISSLKYARQARGSPVIRSDACLIANTGESYRVNMSLFDTGSTTFSFISPKYAESIKHLFPIQKLESPTSVRLGDNKTTKAGYPAFQRLCHSLIRTSKTVLFPDGHDLQF